MDLKEFGASLDDYGRIILFSYWMDTTWFGVSCLCFYS